MSEFYEILGVDPDASQDEIKRAYRRRSRETHPDQGADDNGEFKAVARAYEILSDPELRQRYDAGEREFDQETPRYVEIVISALNEVGMIPRGDMIANAIKCLEEELGRLKKERSKFEGGLSLLRRRLNSLDTQNRGNKKASQAGMELVREWLEGMIAQGDASLRDILVELDGTTKAIDMLHGIRCGDIVFAPRGWHVKPMKVNIDWGTL